MTLRLAIDHERLPPSTRAGEFRVGDLQIWNRHLYRVVRVKPRSKTGKIIEVELLDACTVADSMPLPSRYGRDACSVTSFSWGRLPGASAGRAIYRPLAVIREDPLP